MEGRVRRSRHLGVENSPRVRSEPMARNQQKQQHQYHYHHHHHQQQQQQLPKQPQERKIPVVYYLCRNNHLEQPHFIEVPVSDHGGLYLKDVIDRLNALRGKKMAAMYSWSCKRSYKNGFVWHDLSEDDLLLPAYRNEYVLKGSEILDASPPERQQHPPTVSNSRLLSPKKQQQLREPALPSRVHESSPSSSGTIDESRPIQEDEFSPTVPMPISSPCNFSPDIKPNMSLGNDCSPSFSECNNAYKPTKVTDASTQTEERIVGNKRNQRQEYGRLVDLKLDGSCEVGRDVGFEQQSSSSTPSSDENVGTLESLIRADVQKFRGLEEEGTIPTKAKLKAVDVLMQLITCGSLSGKDQHSSELAPAHNKKFSHLVKIQSPMFNGSIECLSDHQTLMGLKLRDKKYFSGSLIEIKKHEEAEATARLKRSSSYNGDRNHKVLDSDSIKEHESNPTCSKSLQRNTRTANGKQSESETARPRIPISPRVSTEGTQNDQSLLIKRSSDGCPWKASAGPPPKERDTSYKIEERLTSGARITIKTKAPDDI